MRAGAPKTHVSAGLPDRLHAVWANNANDACERLRGASLSYVLGVAGACSGVKTAFSGAGSAKWTTETADPLLLVAPFLKPSPPQGLATDLAWRLSASKRTPDGLTTPSRRPPPAGRPP